MYLYFAFISHYRSYKQRRYVESEVHRRFCRFAHFKALLFIHCSLNSHFKRALGAIMFIHTFLLSQIQNGKFLSAMKVSLKWSKTRVSCRKPAGQIILTVLHHRKRCATVEIITNNKKDTNGYFYTINSILISTHSTWAFSKLWNSVFLGKVKPLLWESFWNRIWRWIFSLSCLPSYFQANSSRWLCNKAWGCWFILQWHASGCQHELRLQLQEEVSLPVSPADLHSVLHHSLPAIHFSEHLPVWLQVCHLTITHPFTCWPLRAHVCYTFWIMCAQWLCVHALLHVSC